MVTWVRAHVGWPLVLAWAACVALELTVGQWGVELPWASNTAVQIRAVASVGTCGVSVAMLSTGMTALERPTWRAWASARAAMVVGILVLFVLPVALVPSLLGVAAELRNRALFFAIGAALAPRIGLGPAMLVPGLWFGFAIFTWMSPVPAWLGGFLLSPATAGQAVLAVGAVAIAVVTSAFVRPRV